MANPVVHFEITGKNGKKMSAFYKKVFGWKANPVGGDGYDYSMVKAGGKGGIAGGFAGGGKPNVTVYVQVKNVDAALKAAVKAGGKIVQKAEKLEGFGLTIGMFKDPDGNQIGVMTPG